MSDVEDLYEQFGEFLAKTRRRETTLFLIGHEPARDGGLADE